MIEKRDQRSHLSSMKEYAENFLGEKLADKDIQPSKPSIAYQRSKMKVVDDRDTLTALLHIVIPESSLVNLDAGNIEDIDKIAELNPSDSIFIGRYESDFESVNADWRLISEFYICCVPNHQDVYLLYSIDWDDNWTRWQHNAWFAIEGVTEENLAKNFLIENFVKSQLPNAEDDWREFLNGL